MCVCVILPCRQYVLSSNRSNPTVRETRIWTICIFLKNKRLFLNTLYIYTYNSSPCVHSHGNPRVAFVQAGCDGGGRGFRDIPFTMKILYYKSWPFLLTTTTTALLLHPVQTTAARGSAGAVWLLRVIAYRIYTCVCVCVYRFHNTVFIVCIFIFSLYTKTLVRE